MLKNGTSYHKSCYKNVIHKHAIDSARVKFERDTSSGDVMTIRKRKKTQQSKQQKNPKFKTEQNNKTTSCSLWVTYVGIRAKPEVESSTFFFFSH